MTVMDVRDADEDFDDDNDTVYDHLDTCPKVPVGWFQQQKPM